MSVSFGKYLCFNGDFLSATEPVLTLNNRSFRFGDALVENIHACGTQAQFLNLHLNRLKQNMEGLSMTVPSFLTVENFSGLVTKLLNKNRIFGGAHVQLIVFRNATTTGAMERIAPEVNTVSFTLASEALAADHYHLNQQGLLVDIFTGMPKPVHRLSSVKSASALLYVIAGLYQTEKKLDDCILINEKGHLAESSTSNIFLLREGRILTPGTEEGCIPGIMRQIIISCILKSKWEFSDDTPLAISDLLHADELFLTDAISGIRWVGAFRQKRYYREVSRLLVDQLNNLAFGK